MRQISRLRIEKKRREGGPVDVQTQSTEEIWERLKSNLTNADESVCGQTRGHHWKRQIWFAGSCAGIIVP